MFYTSDKIALYICMTFCNILYIVVQKGCVIGYVGYMLVQTAPLLTVELLNVQ
jgi:hypothetical protein